MPITSQRFAQKQLKQKGTPYLRQTLSKLKEQIQKLNKNCDREKNKEDVLFHSMKKL